MSVCAETVDQQREEVQEEVCWCKKKGHFVLYHSNGKVFFEMEVKRIIG